MGTGKHNHTYKNRQICKHIYVNTQARKGILIYKRVYRFTQIQTHHGNIQMCKRMQTQSLIYKQAHIRETQTKKKTACSHIHTH